MKKRKFVNFLVALKSGEHGKTEGELVQNTPEKGICFCASGLLAYTLDPTILRQGPTGRYIIGDSPCTLPTSFREIHGISEKLEHFLIQLNDCEEMSFREIASCLNAAMRAGYIPLEED